MSAFVKSSVVIKPISNASYCQIIKLAFRNKLYDWDP
jgi:hypothetical protein